MTAVRKEEETKEMGKIIGICISEKRGTAKHEVETAKLVEDWGHRGRCTRRALAPPGEPFAYEKMKPSVQRGRIFRSAPSGKT